MREWRIKKKANPDSVCRRGSEEHRAKISASRIGRFCGEKHPNWRGGRILIGGYVYVYSPTHENATKDGYVAEHRLVMEHYLGRLLTKDEVVHHLNENVQDNRLENLKLYSSNGKHTAENHAYRDALGRFSCA
jgi:hypothetical protein